MKIAGSILKINKDKEKIRELVNSGVDYLHLDVTDGIFVNNFSLPYEECLKIKQYTNIPLDVHLMVENPLSHIKQFSLLNPEFISFHLETKYDINEIINYLKERNIKIGIAINPETPLDELKKYLKDIDLVLIMSVNPGYGGQAFIESTYKKLEELNNMKSEYNFLVEVDGGVYEQEIKKLKNIDIVVLGSYITDCDNYKNQVKKIGEII